jgi:vacuolar protein sorting-associated protein 54
MSQVFAAINHGLTGEYAAIILPDQDAKDRLFADAKYLHEKLSTLKNVAGASTGMLMTVVSEKTTTITPARSTTNERIRGMLSRQNSVATPNENGTPSPRPVSPSPVQSSPLPDSDAPTANGVTSPPLPTLPDNENMTNGVTVEDDNVVSQDVPQISVNGQVEPGV